MTGASNDPSASQSRLSGLVEIVSERPWPGGIFQAFSSKTVFSQAQADEY